MSLVASRIQQVAASAVRGSGASLRAFWLGSDAFLDFGEKTACDPHPLIFGRVPGFTYPWIDADGKVSSTLALQMPYHRNRSRSLGFPNTCVRGVVGHNSIHPV